MRKKYLLIIVFSIITMLSTLYISLNYKNNKSDPRVFLDSNENQNFHYDYYVNINSHKDNPDYTSINFIIDITPKVDGKFKEVIATAFINNDFIQNSMAIKSYYTFGVEKKEPLVMDRNDSNNKGISIARGTWLYKDTNLDKLSDELKKGIDVEVTWNGGEEHVHVSDVEINIYE